MKPKLQIGDEERAGYAWSRSLSTDADGDETLVGLSVEEANEYLRLSEIQRMSAEQFKRWEDLERVHKLARAEVWAAEHQQIHDKPTLN